jgi:hypothetical protein
VTASINYQPVRCLNPKCRRILPGQPLQMNTMDLRELPKPPGAGDIGICAACGRIMIFTGYGFSVRDPSQQEANVIGNDREVMEIRNAILARLVKVPGK